MEVFFVAKLILSFFLFFLLGIFSCLSFQFNQFKPTDRIFTVLSTLKARGILRGGG